MIAIINYGLGNINAIKTVYNNLNIPVKIASNSDELRDSDKFILPGVGAFDYAMKKLQNSGMVSILNQKIIEEEKNILGICVGMQMLTKSSDEGSLPGLGWFEADVKIFNHYLSDNGLSIPHMGWNNIIPKQDSPILKGLDENSFFYFLHSYYCKSQDTLDVISTTEYGNEFVSTINKKNIYGVQFHPEKSHEAGIKLLKNFSEL